MSYELVIVGAGLTGIRAALVAKELGLENVLIIDYEKLKGGFGSILFNRKGFEAEKELLGQCERLPYEFWQNSTVVGIFIGKDGEKHEISVQTPSGIKTIKASKVMMCSGSLEKPREAHRISGSRPAGIMTPMMALAMLERRYIPGKNCLVIGNGKVSKAVANILEENGSNVTRVNGDFIKISTIKGNTRITEVEILNLKTGETKKYPCDTLVFSEGTIPCTFYLKGTSVSRDPHQNIMIDEKGRTNIPGIYAYGSCTNQPEVFDYNSKRATEVMKEVITTV